jgi:nucleotide-binding universal stress UspA family protein
MAIICGTDLSDAGAGAARVAAGLALALREPLWLVHVVDEGAGNLDTQARDLLLTAATERLREAAEAIPGVSGQRLKTKVLIGKPHEALLSLVEGAEKALLVVSSQGHGSSPLFRMGGTSERVAATSPAPVLVVRNPAPFEAWARGKRPLRVLLGIDFTEGCTAAINWTRTLRAAAPCDLTIGYVYYPDEANHRYGLAASPGKSSRAALERMLTRDLARQVGTMPGKGRLAFRACAGTGRLADHLLSLAEAQRADLVVVGTHHPRGLARLASVAGGALHLAAMSVAVIPNDEGAAVILARPAVRSVLVATDFSPAANAAIPYAHALLARNGGELHLLHVVGPSRTAGSDAPIARRLRAVAAELSASPSVAVQTHVARGPVARRILEAADRLGVDVICLTSHGRTGITKAVLGSVAATVLKTTRRPVFIVPRRTS